MVSQIFQEHKASGFVAIHFLKTAADTCVVHMIAQAPCCIGTLMSVITDYNLIMRTAFKNSYLH